MPESRQRARVERDLNPLRTALASARLVEVLAELVDAEETGGGDVLARAREKPLEFLRERGVPIPDGATASIEVNSPARVTFCFGELCVAIWVRF